MENDTFDCITDDDTIKNYIRSLFDNEDIYIAITSDVLYDNMKQGKITRVSYLKIINKLLDNKYRFNKSTWYDKLWINDDIYLCYDITSDISASKDKTIELYVRKGKGINIPKSEIKRSTCITSFSSMLNDTHGVIRPHVDNLPIPYVMEHDKSALYYHADKPIEYKPGSNPLPPSGCNYREHLPKQIEAGEQMIKDLGYGHMLNEMKNKRERDKKRSTNEYELQNAVPDNDQMKSYIKKKEDPTSDLEVD